MTSRILSAPARGGVSRRGILQGAAALGAAGLILPYGAKAARAQTRGGTFRIGLGHGSTTDSLDPGLWDNLYVQVFAASRHNQLIEVGADGQLVPEMATSWESADGVTWVFAIRQGVSFHSGRDVTVDDVVASINHHRGDDATSAIKTLLSAITDVRADGQNVVITLEAANADLPYLMTDYHIPIMPAVDGRIDPASTDGVGPYIVESYEPGVQASLTRNSNYWKENRAWFDRVEILSILDPAARLNALITGEVHLIDQVDPATIGMLEGRNVARILSIPANAHYVFPMDARAAPFNDNNVRLALKYALDRQAMVDTILGGHGAVSNDNPIGPANRYFFAEMEPKGYDPDRARYHLQQAGLESLDVTLKAADAAFSGAVDAASMFSENARAAGINITVDRVPNDGYWDNVWMKEPFVASYWGGRAVEDHMFTTAYASGADWNDSFWSNERFDELLVAARSEVDESLRREMYHEMQQIVSYEGSVVIPMYNNFVMAVANGVGTPEQIGSNWNLDGFRCVERWWMA
ncbi:ABC transporter substrate-binding protein [Roseicyclus mahoneyensis]|uniref:Peptide/nickel transport system substrate-binding protein n=1 Tax=Roseicyclus mahoneyensis TaxID=164332 RepID=A0A316GZU0_9RHOB|nr:ABC transporter substrate-binding protein [Roseicyclus mahoneyensis]PWK60659.1 peptide/nickel transport system substrate-binding protein [Roseicyclus mahoneyensis]